MFQRTEEHVTVPKVRCTLTYLSSIEKLVSHGAAQRKHLDELSKLVRDYHDHLVVSIRTAIDI